ncbi:MAG: bifunctional folylpolyglutamate synthase/dihydrofolate synthase [Oscillospiraceae bacterium]
MVSLKEVSLGLESITNLCELLGNPQDRFKSIHIAGTNGKGSVGAYLESILIENGYTVGRYVSPAIENICETITINRKSITLQDYEYYRDKVENLAKVVVSKGIRNPSPFEIETAIAYEYLSRKCDIALIEVGMGGRLDATNVLHNKILSVITSISLDHTQFLGDTLSQIAFEKSGIIQDGVPTVTICQDSEILEVIENVCRDKNSPLWVANSQDVSNVGISSDYTLSFDYLNYKCVKSKLIGDFQVDNAILSIKASEILGISKDIIMRGIYGAIWKYRFEIVSYKPLIVLDGCHNVGASIRLKKSIDTYFKDKSICYIMGIFKDKDYKSIVKNLCPSADVIYTVATSGDRSLSAKTLAQEIKKYNNDVIPCESISKAIEFSKISNRDVTIIFGSLSTLGEFRRLIEKY